MSNPLPGLARSDTRKRLGLVDAGGEVSPRPQEAATQGLLNAAQLGTALAGYYLGVVYQMSRNALPHGATAAASWMANTADQGKAKAHSFFDFIYEIGWDMPTSDDLLRWLSWSGQGNRDGEQRQGFLHTIGQAGLTRNESEAALWLVKAALQGNAGSKYSLAFKYDKSRGELHRNAEVERWVIPPSQDGDKQAQRILQAWGQRW